MRLNISKLGELSTSPTKAKLYRNALLQSPSWQEEIPYLRELYTDVSVLGDEDTSYFQVEPKVLELLSGLDAVSQEVPYDPNSHREVRHAKHDLTIATMHAERGDEYSAGIHLTHALDKLHKVLDILSSVAATAPRDRTASFIDKKAYGYDISGEVFEGSGELANRENQENLNDTGTPDKHHETAPNPANLTRDTNADKEYGDILEARHEKVSWPPRIR